MSECDIVEHFSFTYAITFTFTYSQEQLVTLTYDLLLSDSNVLFIFFLWVWLYIPQYLFLTGTFTSWVWIYRNDFAVLYLYNLKSICNLFLMIRSKVFKMFTISCSTVCYLPEKLMLCNFMLGRISLNPMSDAFPFIVGLLFSLSGHLSWSFKNHFQVHLQMQTVCSCKRCKIFYKSFNLSDFIISWEYFE